MKRLLFLRRTRSRQPRAWYLACVLFVIFANTAFAQQPAGTIEGTVVDQSGGAVAGAAVTVVQAATRATWPLLTSDAGEFRAPNLPPGRYEITVTAPGFADEGFTVDVEVGRVRTVLVPLSLRKLEGSVTVEAKTVQVNTTQVALEGVVTSALIRRLPFNGRYFLDSGSLEPGTQGVPDDAFTRAGFARLSFAGQTGLSTRVTVDGLDINDEHAGSVALNLSAETIQEFQVSRALFDISTGLTGAGAVNVVTKSGGNQWHGDVFDFWRGGRTAPPGGLPAAPFHRTQAGARAGGRIVRDRAFVFAGYEMNDQRATAITTVNQFPQLNGAWPVPFNEHLGTIRLDVARPVRTFVRVTYDSQQGTSGPTIGGVNLAPLQSSRRSLQIGAGLDVVAGRRFIHSLRVGYSDSGTATDLGLDGVLDQIPGFRDLVAPGGRLLTLSAQGLIGAHYNAPVRRDQNTNEFRYDGGVSRGAHDLRWGADLNFIRIFWLETLFATPSIALDVPKCGSDIMSCPVRNLQMGNGVGYYGELPSQGHPHGGSRNTRLHLYAADTWRLQSRLTLTAGVRWVDEPGAANPNLTRPAILDTFRPGLATASRRDLDNFAPQIGLAWSPAADRRWVVRGGFGIFYEANRLQNILWTEQVSLLPAGTADNFETRVFHYPDGRVLFDMTPWLGKPLGTDGLINAVFAARDAYQAAYALAAATSPALPSQCETARSCTVLASDYRTPMSRHYTIGFQRELRPGMVLSMDYVHTDGRHFLMRHDINRLGAADTLDRTKAIEAMRLVHLSAKCDPGPAGVDCAIKSGKKIADYASQGLGRVGPTLASIFGSSNAAFPGMNPDFNTLFMLESNGRSTYNALQINLRGGLPDAGRILRTPYVIASYALGRYEGTLADQFAVNGFERVDNDNALGFLGPTSLDRTHILSVAAMGTAPGGVQVNVLLKASSALPQTLYVPQKFSGTPGAEIFATDFNGDGTSQDMLPGTNRGSYGRGIGCGAEAINRVINVYNATQANHLTPAGRELVNAGLFTETQLRNLGAVSPEVKRAPDRQVCLGSFSTVDLRLARPFTVSGGRITIEPALEVFNLFNARNYDLPDSKLNGTLNAAVGSLNNTTPATRTNRAGVTGNFSPGAPRSWQLALRVSF